MSWLRSFPHGAQLAFNNTNKRDIFELMTSQFINRREDALFLGPPGTGQPEVTTPLLRRMQQHDSRIACLCDAGDAAK